MDKNDKRRFLEDLVASVLESAIDAIPKMPEEWDGFELREYMAEKFRQSSGFDRRPDMKRRAKDFYNELNVRNL